MTAIQLWRCYAVFVVHNGMFLFSILFLLVPPLSGRETSLFKQSQHVVELTSGSLGEAIESSEPWIVNTYSPSCPHCQRYAPKWEEVGGALKDCINVGALNCLQYKESCRGLRVSRYPTILALNWPGAPLPKDGKPATKVMEKAADVQSIKDQVDDIFRVEMEAPPGPPGFSKEERELGISEIDPRGAVGRQPHTGALCKDRLEDAVASVRYTLRNDVFIEGTTLSDERRGTLLSFLKLLGTTFPGSDNRASFRALAKDLERKPSLSDMKRWDERISSMKIGRFEARDSLSWPAAALETGNSGSYHFTSGLWALFHILSVSQVQSKQEPYAIMEGIKLFVENFFRCEICQSHFLDMYRSCENDRCEIRKTVTPSVETHLALWVWKAHNAVNVRLAQEEAEERNAQGSGGDEIDPWTKLWPKPQLCPECWAGFPAADQEPPWSTTDVSHFLTATYWCPEDIVDNENPGAIWIAMLLLGSSFVVLTFWAQQCLQSRGIGMTKKRADTLPGP